MAANGAETTDREIVVSRVIDAPREVVFEAWTHAESVAQWWGPDDFTSTIHEMDVRPGGVWRHVLHGPDGTDYPNKSIFTVVVSRSVCPTRTAERRTAQPLCSM